MTTVEGIFNEIEQLRMQHEEALAQLKDAEGKLEELNERRIELAPAAFTGDEVADKNLMILEGEASKLSRGVRLARHAAKEFERLIEEAKKRRAEERQRLARERFEELAAERYQLGVKAEETMSTLLAVLECYKPVHAEQVACARGFGDDSPVTNVPNTLIQNWLISRLGEYLGLSPMDHYDGPLPEVDGLAAKSRDRQ
ncbi:MAG TPA: hypothetical protein VE288_10605 [Rubrobacteraceae bacterium]|jgi:septal ring factor EnvC (AmiA/AmiB activator)|nr:hypothetical protein [Rubrobacteraceae bacterium]